MSNLTKFQAEHGEQWHSITQSPAFVAAMSYLNIQKISSIASLTDEDIEGNGNLILADLRGHLRHENDLFTIGTKPSLEFGGIGPETYPNPLDEIEILPGDNSEPTTEPESQQPVKPRKPRKK